MKIVARVAVWVVALALAFGVGFGWRDVRVMSGGGDLGLMLASTRSAFAALISGRADSPSPTQVFREHYRRIASDYYRTVDPVKLRYAAMSGLFASLGDPHTQFLDPALNESFEIDTTGDFSGVGASLSPDPLGAKVERVFEGAPAYRGGLKVGDRIIAVNGESSAGQAIDDIVTKIKGPTGTQVRIQVMREGKPQPFWLELVRERVLVPTVTAKVIEGDVGYLQISNFSNLTTNQFDRELDRMEADSLNGLVVDLRGNPGGLLDTARDMLSRFVENKPVVTMRMRGGFEETVRTDAGRLRSFRYPVVVLIDEQSASAAEIFAGVLHDFGRVTLVGEHTYGKASVQNVFPLIDRSAAKITIARYYLPSGEDISRRVDADGAYISGGLKPDVEVELEMSPTTKIGEPAHDSQLRKAVEIIREQR